MCTTHGTHLVWASLAASLTLFQSRNTLSVICAFSIPKPMCLEVPRAPQGFASQFNPSLPSRASATYIVFVGGWGRWCGSNGDLCWTEPTQKRLQFTGPSGPMTNMLTYSGIQSSLPPYAIALTIVASYRLLSAHEIMTPRPQRVSRMFVERHLRYVFLEPLQVLAETQFSEK